MTLLVRGITVRTTAATRFDEVRCGVIGPGTEIEVRGTRNGNEVVADRIKAEDDHHDHDESLP